MTESCPPGLCVLSQIERKDLYSSTSAVSGSVPILSPAKRPQQSASSRDLKVPQHFEHEFQDPPSGIASRQVRLYKTQPHKSQHY